MNLDIEAMKAAARAADQGVWSIGQVGIETNGGLIDFWDENSEEHTANKRFVGIAGNPTAVLALIERLEAAEERNRRYRQMTGVAFGGETISRDEYPALADAICGPRAARKEDA